MHTWLAFANGCKTSGWWYDWSRRSIRPFIQWTYFTGLSLWLGTTLALDIRLLGAGKRFQTGGELSDALFSWNWLGLGIAILATAPVWIPNY